MGNITGNSLPPRRTDLVFFLKDDEVDLSLLQARANGKS